MFAAARRWMIVLLMLAVPMQGAVASTMRLCESMHLARGAAMAAAGEDHALHAMHGGSRVDRLHADAPAACHDALAPAGAVDAQVVSGGGEVEGACSACAACCLTGGTAAPAPEVASPAVLPLHGGVLIEPAAGWRPERLERPPRSS